MSKIKSSPRAGMGAIPFAGGIAFRVWSPHAEAVFVMGSFNDWSKTAHPLFREERGYWYVEITGAQIGDHYKYLIKSGGAELFRLDPYAREVTSSVGDAIIHDPQFDWGSADFLIPKLNELVIYELHIGTFNDTPGGRPALGYDRVHPQCLRKRERSRT